MREKRGTRSGKLMLWIEEFTIGRHCHIDGRPPSGDADHKIRIENLLLKIRDMLGNRVAG